VLAGEGKMRGELEIGSKFSEVQIKKRRKEREG
jgi:hypothetical protein